MQNGIWITSFVAYGLLAAIIPSILGHLGTRDTADIYVVFTLGKTAWEDALFSVPAVSAIGPTTAPLSEFVQAPPVAHQKMVDAGLWVIPGSLLAALCGFSTTSNEST